jgi:NADH:ubiquinone oxidoreductase subunit 6 (subunit J)
VIQAAPAILTILLVVSCVAALLVRRLLWSLILLFYSSLLLGGILFWYGAVYAGLFHIITFAGAVSVMFMVIIMLTGEEASEVSQPPRRQYYVGAILSFIGFIVFSLAVIRISAVPGKYEEASLLSTSGSSMNELGFLWNLRSWDLLFVLVAIFAAMLTVVNLFMTEGEVE